MASNGKNQFTAQTTKVANRDAASFLSLKVRQPGQGLVEERGSRRELKEQLEEKEQRAREERLGLGAGSGKTEEKKAVKAPRVKAVEDAANPFPEDADEEVASNSEASGDDDDDDDEDAEELMRELAKIKKEREAEEQVKKDQQAKVDGRAMRDEVMKGNELLTGDTSLKRRWDDDCVFKNQARTAPKQKQRYINDSVRSDFHKRFLNKYVWMDGIAH